MNKKKSNPVYLLVYIEVGIFSMLFISIMCFLNYRSMAIKLETQIIGRIESDTVSKLETSLSFGKSFNNYHGMEDIFESFRSQYEGLEPFVVNTEGKILYVSEKDESDSNLAEFLTSGEYEREISKLSEKVSVVSGDNYAVFSAVRENEEIVGYFGCIYKIEIFKNGLKDIKVKAILTCLIIIVLEILVTFLFVKKVRRKNEQDAGSKDSRRREKIIFVLIFGTGIVILSVATLCLYQKDYRNRIRQSVESTFDGIEETINRVSAQGVDLYQVDGLNDYVKDNALSPDFIESVEVIEESSEHVSNPDYMVFRLNSGNAEKKALYIEAKISEKAVNAESINLVLVLTSTLIILLIFSVEFNNLAELSAAKHEISKGSRFSERHVSLSLRFTGFLASTAECMCVPYAAMMIRDSGKALFGLSVGMTAALPLTLESIGQMAGMLILPRFVKKYKVNTILVISSALMIVCNMTVFVSGAVLTIVICRGLAGIAYVGFKQVSNFLITAGYETEAGRAENISMDNAGLLAGATCGAGLGAIISANVGYSKNFLFSSIIFLVYLFATLILPPWEALREREEKEEKKTIHFKNVLRVLKSREMLLYILLIGIPLNIGVMLCVTLIPAVCQTQGISSVMLSYCYIANGLAGIYIGPSLVSKAKERFGLKLSIAFAFMLTGISIFILHLPPVALMIVITSMVLGFLDGFGTPLAVDKFMSLKTVKKEMDESSALIFSVVIFYVLLTFAPIIAELMIIPGKGFLNPMMLGGVIYSLVAILIIVLKKKF